jgi:Domain of Unknown Function (DUF1080)
MSNTYMNHFPKHFGRDGVCKRIFLMAMVGLMLGAGAVDAAEKGFVSLFDGESLTGWNYIGNQGGEYFVTNGTIVCPGNSHGNLLTDAEYSDFVLRLEFACRTRRKT